MNVLLKTAVKGLGRAGQVVEVADAYARNFLLPQQRAVIATAAIIKQQDQQTAAAAKHIDQQRTQRDQLVQRLQGQTINLSAEASSGGKLFAALKTDAFYQAVKHQTGLAIQAGRWTPDHIKTLGDHAITISWPSGQSLTFTLHVIASH